LSDINWKRAFKHALVTTVLFFLIVFTICGVLIITNYAHLGRLVKVIGLIENQYLEVVPLEKLVDGAIEGMSNLDRYSAFQTAEERQSLMNEIEGQLSGGIGITFQRDDTGRLVVERTFKGSPAESVLAAGDLIEKINGEPVNDMTQMDVISKMRGDIGTAVALYVYRESTNEYFECELIRAVINLPSVEWEEYPGEPDIAVIHISSYTTRTPQDFDAVLKEIDETQRYKGIIIDMRNNGGGELNACIEMTSRLIPQGPVMHIIDRRGNKRSQDRVPGAQFIDRPFVIMVNENSASATEVTTGAVKDHKSAPIVGTKTFGKGVIQHLYELDGNTGLRLTVQRYLTPYENNIDKIGVEPDHLVNLKDGERITICPKKDPDSQMQKACEVLKGIMI
jgi:carboxyl-terminal processing protease